MVLYLGYEHAKVLLFDLVKQVLNLFIFLMLLFIFHCDDYIEGIISCRHSNLVQCITKYTSSTWQLLLSGLKTHCIICTSIIKV